MRSHLPFVSVLLAASLVLPRFGANVRAQATAGLTQYTFGTPSGDETEILAYINRARANPAAEGQRLVAGLDGSNPGVVLLLSQFQSYPTRPPLAFNAKLNAAAQQHTADMIAMGRQSHDSPDGTPYGIRIQRFGYTYPHGENVAGGGVYPAPVTPWFTENAYENDTIDPYLYHRLAIMEPNDVGSVEVGIAQHAVGGWNTEDFGANQTPPLLTGAAFTDNAGIGFYASGEGVASVVVTAPGASSFYAVTVESGAYTLPLDLVPAYSAGAPAPVVQVVFTDALHGNVTTKNVTLTHTVGTDGSVYYDAYSNVRYDNAQVNLVQPGSAHPAFFTGEAALAHGVYYLAFPAGGNFFGYYAYLPDAHFLYHFDLGYEYIIDAADGQSGVYLYDFTSTHWFYTSPTFRFPYLYDFTLGSVLYYYPDPNHPGRYNTDGVRWFYNYATGKIIAL